MTKHSETPTEQNSSDSHVTIEPLDLRVGSQGLLDLWKAEELGLKREVVAKRGDIAGFPHIVDLMEKLLR